MQHVSSYNFLAMDRKTLTFNFLGRSNQKNTRPGFWKKEEGRKNEETA